MKDENRWDAIEVNKKKQRIAHKIGEKDDVFHQRHEYN